MGNRTADIKGECNWYWNERKGCYECDCDIAEELKANT